MRIQLRRMTRRGVGVAAAVAMAGAMLLNLPAEAQNDTCTELQQRYTDNPELRPQLLPFLVRFGCTVPGTTSTTTSSTSSTTTTLPPVPNPGLSTCLRLQEQYLASPPSVRPLLVTFLQEFGCTVPPIPTTTTTTTPTSTTSTSTTSTSTTSTSTSTTSTTSTTIDASSLACNRLLAQYESADAETREALLPSLVSFGCTVPNGNS